MKRRKFISITSVATVGLVVPNLLISCNGGDKINLNEIIGKPEKLLEQFPKEGDSDFAYFTIPSSDFEHSLMAGFKAFIYCQKEVIVGYTIRKKGINKTEEYSKQLSQKFGNKKIVFENDFGKEYEWRTNNKKITLCFSKNHKDLSQNIYFSESTINNELIVF